MVSNSAEVMDDLRTRNIRPKSNVHSAMIENAREAFDRLPEIRSLEFRFEEGGMNYSFRAAKAGERI